MGIKGIYKEIGTGKRIALTKLAVDTLEETGRPLRLAIDISIWQFQVQAARGGSNPAIRTLFYRLLRLLSLSIQPIFVFDGPKKPVFKRNKRAGRGDGVATAMAKRLIRLFGFQVHDAPGEAEAECALLQQHGIVDAVISEDVDTIMFGCTRTLRNWSAEGRGSKTPTHISMYDTKDLSQGSSGLDREGMVLVALMSGGDYLPEGIPGAGVKLACEAARAGFGKSLCRLKRSDTSELASWKEWLSYELQHNESGFFRTRHKALAIPEEFPNIEILRYYTHPVVSPASTLERLKQQTWDNPIDIEGLREFTRETFDWSYRIGAIKFIRVLAPCLLVRKIMQRSALYESRSDDMESLQQDEAELVKTITNKRTHFSTDATPELRLSFIPTSIVGYDFQNEPDEVIDYGRDGLALNSDDDMEALVDEDGTESVTKAGSKKPYIPTEPDLLWIPETVAKFGIPLIVEDWEEAQRAKAAKVATRSKPKATKQKTKSGGMANGALDRFTKVTKNTTRPEVPDKEPGPDSLTRIRSPLRALPPYPQPLPSVISSSQDIFSKQRPTRSSKPPSSKSRTSKSSRKVPAAPALDSSTNPWTIASLQASPRATKSAFAHAPKPAQATEAILISSSPPTSPTTDDRSAMKDKTDQKVIQQSSTVLSSPPVSPQKRRYCTPPRLHHGNSVMRHLSPSPSPGEKPQRKLARTESLPVEVTPVKLTCVSKGTRGLARAQTIAVEPLPLDPDSNSDSDNEFDLPPLITLINRLPGRRETPTSHCSSRTATSLAPTPTKPTPGTNIIDISESVATRSKSLYPELQRSKQPTVDVRMTKLFAPRKSLPGFYREIDVRADEADAVKEKLIREASGGRNAGIGGRRTAVYRRSDVEVIDLTGVE
ncbi:hypothetical protein F5Y15DRAFT_374895 [Xylariaceae sp. FL0016]|nr:hypothetical protein F5Y15DRAFT_374895 [Xylariaceae sp. FL0016]